MAWRPGWKGRGAAEEGDPPARRRRREEDVYMRYPMAGRRGRDVLSPGTGQANSRARGRERGFGLGLPLRPVTDILSFLAPDPEFISAHYSVDWADFQIPLYSETSPDATWEDIAEWLISEHGFQRAKASHVARAYVHFRDLYLETKQALRASYRDPNPML